MELAGFPESNAVLDKPADMTHDECTAAEVCRTKLPNGATVVVTCWKCTAEELAEINRTGRVWLMIWGPTMPPAVVLGVSPFPKQD